MATVSSAWRPDWQPQHPPNPIWFPSLFDIFHGGSDFTKSFLIPVRLWRGRGWGGSGIFHRITGSISKFCALSAKPYLRAAMSHCRPCVAAWHQVMVKGKTLLLSWLLSVVHEHQGELLSCFEELQLLPAAIPLPRTGLLANACRGSFLARTSLVSILSCVTSSISPLSLTSLSSHLYLLRQ